MFKPFSGILLQKKWVNLKYCPLEFEFEIADQYDPIVSLGQNGNTAAAVGSTSYSWTIQNCVMKADICQLDSGVDNKYDERVISGGDLKLNFYRIISNLQTLVSNNASVNISRSCHSLAKVFVSFDKDITGGSAAGSRASVYNCKWWNNFCSPMCGDAVNGAFDPSHEIQGISLQIGSKVFPDYPIVSHGEAMYHLGKCLGIASNNLRSLNITGQDFRNTLVSIPRKCLN